MSSDFEGYEQDFAVLTAEITSKIARVPRLPPDEKKQMVANVEKQLEEAKELLEQMDLEVREIPPQSRGMYSNRMRSYKQEMGKLETDFKHKRILERNKKARLDRTIPEEKFSCTIYFLTTMVPKAPLGEIVGKSSCNGPSLFKLFILGFDLGTSYTRKVASNRFKARHRKWTQYTRKTPKSSQLW